MTIFQKMRAVLIMCAALGWWGVWFPDLAVWADAVCVTEDVSQEEAVQMEENVVEYGSAREICNGLLNADQEQIRIKSRLYMLLKQHIWNK